MVEAAAGAADTGAEGEEEEADEGDQDQDHPPVQHAGAWKGKKRRHCKTEKNKQWK